MTDTRLYRKATVSRAKATENLFKSYPDANLVGFEQKKASVEDAKSTPGAKPGDLIYVATIRVAEFPPADDGGEEDTEPKAEKKSPPSDDGGAPEGEDKSEGDGDGDSDDAAPEFGSDADGPAGPGEPHAHKMNPAEETNHLLTQILHALQGGGAGLGGPPDAGLGGPDLPDVGAPPQGEGLGGPTKAPLPPPVAPHSPAMPGGAFSSVTAGKKEFVFTRLDVKADGLGHRGLIAEARELAPGYRVAKLVANEAEDTATLTMIRE